MSSRAEEDDERRRHSDRLRVQHLTAESDASLYDHTASLRILRRPAAAATQSGKSERRVEEEKENVSTAASLSQHELQSSPSPSSQREEEEEEPSVVVERHTTPPSNAAARPALSSRKSAAAAVASSSASSSLTPLDKQRALDRHRRSVLAARRLSASKDARESREEKDERERRERRRQAWKKESTRARQLLRSETAEMQSADAEMIDLINREEMPASPSTAPAPHASPLRVSGVSAAVAAAAATGKRDSLPSSSTFYPLPSSGTAGKHRGK